MPDDGDAIRLRGNKPRLLRPWELGAVPSHVISRLGRLLVHRIAVGHSDVTGDDFATMLSFAMEGEHRPSPLGLSDVVREGNSWSAKTVKNVRPFEVQTIRLIMGRNSPIYSSGITDPFSNVQATGSAVLGIWNERVNESLAAHNTLGIIVLVRNMETREFLLFEEDAILYPVGNYKWQVNDRNNLEGYDVSTQRHVFTWQPHGGQLTIIAHVPGSAIKFRITRNPPIITEDQVLDQIGYSDDWVEIVN
jgi:hypothetical protein